MLALRRTTRRWGSRGSGHLLAPDPRGEALDQPSDQRGEAPAGPLDIGAGAVLLIAASGLAMFLLFCLIRGSLIDDSYITLSYAKNLALHLHWGVVPQEFSNTATSPLNVALLGALSAVTRVAGGVHPVFALGAESVALVMIMAWGWLRVIRVWRLPLTIAALGVAVVLVNPFLLSAVGLEVLLVPTLLIVLLATALEDRPLWFGVVAGLIVLCRLDLIVFVLAIAAATPTVRRRWQRSLGIAAVVSVPWFAFSWLFFGSALPDTLVIKTSQHWVLGFMVGQVLYFAGHPNLIAIAFIPALIGLSLLIVWLVARTSVRWEPAHRLPAIGPAAGLGAGGVAYYGVLSVLDVPPYHWYYVPPLTSLSMFLVIAVGVWLKRARELPRLRPAVPAVVLGVIGLLVLGTLGRDLAQGVPWRAPAISTNFATAGQYARLAIALHKRIGNATVENNGEVGTLAYFCDCHIVELFSDRRQAIALIDEHIAKAGPLARLIYKVNYHWLDRSQKPLHPRYFLHHTFGPAPQPFLEAWPVVSHTTLVAQPAPGYEILTALP